MSSVEALCCSANKALALQPVPVIENMLYVPGAEGLSLTELGQKESVDPCPAHRFNFAQTVSQLIECARRADKGCKCQRFEESHQKNKGEANNCTEPEKNHRLWAFETHAVIEAYSWLNQNRCREYPGGSEAVIVCQMKRSSSLPPGLYVYRRKPRHFGCTLERPLTVLKQHNFECRTDTGVGGLPNAITIEMFPGQDSFSAIYVMDREAPVPKSEYSNRLFGEARAVGVLDICCLGTAVPCLHLDVAVRTERRCVLDLRWSSFDTATQCLRAVPGLRGLQAVVWSNHRDDVQKIESGILSWLFRVKNELPRGVQLIDRTHEEMALRYTLLSVNDFPGVLPKPPVERKSFFTHVFFSGDTQCATMAVGEVPVPWSRMGSPCSNQRAFGIWYLLPRLRNLMPTPFSCGIKYDNDFSTREEEGVKNHLLEWADAMQGNKHLGIAVQYTLFYDGRKKTYDMMITHTIMAKDDNFNIFRL
ncbi:hypothetical protein WMY93_031113 [Mugilogobius chulae]|uniref:Uncharacterized protein n=1 Tax=Mugilogobius chulae TaxID=88201 RepID=A0AAW0MGS9_9GOBI